MEPARHVQRSDLARQARQVFDAVRQGQTVIVERRGHPQAALLDVTDYHLLRAALHYFARHQEVDAGTGLSDEAFAACATPQEHYDKALAYYLAGAISLSRAAELLGLAPHDLRRRLGRLDVPLRAAPTDVEEARRDVQTALSWETPSA